MNSTDAEKVKESFQKSDKLIENLTDKNAEIEVDGVTTRIGFNKTQINKSNKHNNNNEQKSVNSNDGAESNQEAFLKVMEQDANERYERKKAAQKKADQIKELGNEQFKLKNYEKALEFYNEAIQTIRDNQVLYTNRAQVYIILKKFNDAISDCDWALRVNQLFFISINTVNYISIIKIKTKG